MAYCFPLVQFSYFRWSSCFLEDIDNATAEIEHLVILFHSYPIRVRTYILVRSTKAKGTVLLSSGFYITACPESVLHAYCDSIYFISWLIMASLRYISAVKKPCCENSYIWLLHKLLLHYCCDSIMRRYAAKYCDIHSSASKCMMLKHADSFCPSFKLQVCSNCIVRSSTHQETPGILMNPLNR